MFVSQNIESSDWQRFFTSTELLSQQSLMVSERLNHPVVILTDEQRLNWQTRQQLVDSLALPAGRDTDVWLSRYRTRLTAARLSGVAIKQPDNLNLPCFVSVGDSYHQHVASGGIFNRLTKYNYHPYADRAKVYEEMVKWHEVGHCFEDFGGQLGEIYADIFAVLVMSERFPIDSVVRQQMQMRWLELLDGGGNHLSSLFLQQLVEHMPQQTELRFRYLPKLSHYLLSSISAAKQNQLNNLSDAKHVAQFYSRRLQSEYVEQLLAKVKESSGQRELEIAQFLRAQQSDLTSADRQLAKQINHQQVALHLQPIIRSMLEVREQRNHLMSAKDLREFREDVNRLMSTMQQPSAGFASGSDQEWLKQLKADLN